MNNPQTLVGIAAIALLLTAAAKAQTVYKSVDEEGRVTYSEEPPAQADALRVEEVQIAPGPTEEQRIEAERRAKQQEATAKMAADKRNKETEKASGDLDAAQERLRSAELALKEAKIESDDDWQYLATGGRVLKQSYFERIQGAERKVQEAQDAVRDAKRSPR